MFLIQYQRCQKKIWFNDPNGTTFDKLQKAIIHFHNIEKPQGFKYCVYDTKNDIRYDIPYIDWSSL